MIPSTRLGDNKEVDRGMHITEYTKFIYFTQFRELNINRDRVIMTYELNLLDLVLESKEQKMLAFGRDRDLQVSISISVLLNMKLVI